MDIRYSKICKFVIGFLLCASLSFAGEELVVNQSRDISGGINETDEQSTIKDNQSTVLINAIFRDVGKVNKRDGIEDIATNLTTINSIYAMKHYYKLGDATKRLMIEHEGKWQYWTGSANGLFSDVTTSGISSGNTDFLVAGNVAWRLNPSDNCITWDGTDLSISGNTVTDPPRCGAGLYHKGRVILYRNTTNPDYFWWSQVGPELADLKTFDRTVYAAKVDSGDNQELVALVEYGLSSNPGLLAFKEDSVYFVDTSQADPADWIIVKLYDGIGCIARRTAVKVGDDVYYLSRDGGTYKVRNIKKTEYDSINVDKDWLSSPIDTIMSDLSDAYIEDAAAIYYDGYYILTVPSGSSTYNDLVLVYDTISEAWVQFTGWTPSVFAPFLVSDTEALYMASDLSPSSVYQCFEGTDDDGEAITYQEESRKFDMGSPHLDKVWKDLEFAFTSTSDYNADIYVELDDAGWTYLGYVNLLGDIVLLPQTLPFTLKSGGIIRKTFDTSVLGRSRTLKFKIVQDSTGLAMNFERLAVFIRAWVEAQRWEEG